MVKFTNKPATKRAKGRLVSFERNGCIQRGRLMYSDQREEFARVNKSLVVLIDDNFDDMLNEKQQRQLSLVCNDILKSIGFID